jgi:RimJ/RimL family protein N-acetyltransferase
MSIRVVRLTSADVARFREARLEGLRSDPIGFRYSEAEDAAIASDVWAARLDRDFVIAALRDESDTIAGVGGYSRFAGDKLSHKGLIWGMFVRSEARGSGAADAIMEALVAHARLEVRQLQLTVMADNARARRFYERHGFAAYATEPEAVRQGDEYRDEISMWLPLERGSP